jgi:hypothetical protein
VHNADRPGTPQTKFKARLTQTRFIYLFFGLFNVCVNRSDYIATNEKLINELERILKEAVVANVRYCPSICLRD